jgi:tol-pal system protein YbgF
VADIFISYSRDDRGPAERLAKALAQQGWSVWWDPEIPAGKTFDEVIEEAIDAAKCVVVLWSTHSVTSRWVRTEASEGADRGILVLVLVEDVRIPLAFRRIQAANLIEWDGTPAYPAFAKLVTDIADILGPPPAVSAEQQRQAAEATDRTPQVESEQWRRAGPKVQRTDDADKANHAKQVSTVEPSFHPAARRSPLTKTVLRGGVVVAVVLSAVVYVIQREPARDSPVPVGFSPTEPSQPPAPGSEPIKEPSYQPAPEEPSIELSAAQWREVQKSLNDIGFDAGPIDGMPGSKTRQAISLFQNSRGFPSTGKLTETQLARLLSDTREAAQGQLGAVAEPITPSPRFDPDREKMAYLQAFEMLKAGSYPEAIQSFRRYLVDFPDGNYADKAQYWIAEANYVQRSFHAAIGEFTEVLDRFPSSPKAPSSLLKIGFIHYELGEWSNAKEVLSRVIQDYPNSTEAGLAEERLDRIRREGH